MRQRRHRQRKQWHNHQRQDTVAGFDAGANQEQKGDEDMGRNEDKYFYLRDVAFEKGSWVLDQFLADASDHSAMRALGQFLVTRAGDYYRDQARLLAVQASPTGVESGPAETTSASSMTAATTAAIESSRRGKGKKVAAVVEEPLSADDFADVYDMDM